MRKNESEILKIDEHVIKSLPWVFGGIRVLQVATLLNIFDFLKEWRSEEEIIRKFKISKEKEEAFINFLQACSALNLLVNENRKYRNSMLANKYLFSGSKSYLGHWIMHSYDLWAEWSMLEKWIGVNVKRKESWLEKLVLGLYEITINSEAKELARKINLKKKRHLLDVGGGAGSFSIAFCRRYKELRATIFDQPESIKLAREMARKNRLEDRISFIEGDWDKHGFGSGYDVVFMSNVLHGKESKAEMKLRKAYNALEDNGMLIVRDFLLKESSKTKLNKKAALFNLMVGAYTFEELKNEIEKAGFKSVRKMKLPRNFQPVLIAYKK